MLGKIRARLTYANVMATLGVFLGISGVAWAASLPGNSVGPNQIRKDAVGASEIRKKAVAASEVKNGSLTQAEFAPGTLLQGPPGTPGQNGVGQTGPRGPSDAFATAHNNNTQDVGTTEELVAGLSNLPAGKYVVLVSARVLHQGDTTSPEQADCNIRGDHPTFQKARGVIDLVEDQEAEMAVTGTATVNNGSLTFNCTASGTNLSVDWVRMQAILVETLTGGD